MGVVTYFGPAAGAGELRHRSIQSLLSHLQHDGRRYLWNSIENPNFALALEEALPPIGPA